MNTFTWPVRVYYEDTDAGGVVFYANYLKFFERARTEFLRAAGFEQDRLMQEAEIIFVVRSVAVDYLKPARFNDLLDVTASVSEAKKTSFSFTQQVKRQGEILSQGNIRIACLDINTMRPKVIPSEILQAITHE